MSEKILYLLGAGASAQALPIVKDSPDGSIKGLSSAFNAMADYISALEFENKERAFANELISHLRELAIYSKSFTTIDTYAKHLYLVNKIELEKLKITLSIYFAIEQLHFNKRDLRYQIFLTTIMDRVMFPDNIKILTWNYDFQMELAGYLYRQEEVHKMGTVTRSSPGLLNYYPLAGNSFPVFADNADLDAYHILHLNGIAGVYNIHQSYDCDNIFLRINKKEEVISVQEIIKHYLHKGKEKVHLLTFAWENGDTNASAFLKRKMLFANQMIQDTTILVVIGYSFPYFNRQIDRQIFSTLKSSGKLKTIYFQDPYLDGSFLINQFELNDVPIKHISRTDAFYVPSEL